MRVSTVIPVYNRPVLVERAIVASLEQGYEDHEVVVIDNCSTDGTWEVLQRWANRDERIKCFRNERNLGPVRNWKRGVELATGELCHLLFSDDSVEPDFLRLTVPQLDPETAFVMVGHTKWTDSGPVGNSSFQREPEIPRDKFLDAGIFWNPNQIQMINTVSALFRRSDLRTAIIDDIPNPLGLVHADHGAGPDILIFMLIASRYRRVRCVNQLLARMYSHDGSITVQSKDLRIPREWVR